MRAGRDSKGCRWLVGHLHLCPAGTWHRQVMSNALPEAAGRKNAARPCLSPQPQPGGGLHGPQIGPVLLVFMVISQSIPCPRCCSTLWGCLCRCMGRMVPVQRSASAPSERQNEMSGACPQPGCAPAACHSFVPPQSEHSRCPATSPAAGSSASRLVPYEWGCLLGVWAVSVLLCL